MEARAPLRACSAFADTLYGIRPGEEENDASGGVAWGLTWPPLRRYTQHDKLMKDACT